jgi:phosphatidylserine/phosphatidylglycerophosphate/cardiolipin synthase-like enzyme
MDFEGGKIQVFFGPPAYGAPDDLEKVIVDFINEAEESLEIAVQELDDPNIADAIDRASRRKKTSRPSHRISVNVIVEADYLREKKPLEDDIPGDFEENRALMRLLLRGAVHYKLDFNASTFHQKFIVRDYNRPKEAVLTGSTNFTKTGTGANLNNVVIFHSHELAKFYHDEFRELKEGVFGLRSPRGHKAPEIMIGNTKVYPLFAPDHSPELIIVNGILQSRESVHLVIFTFSGSTTIDNALLRIREQGIPVKGVLDRMASASRFSPHPALIEAGARLRRHKVPTLSDFGKPGKLHHKTMVLERKVVISGSFNYTDPANRYNDENVFFIHNSDIAEYYIEEIDRIFNDLAEDFPPTA